MNWSKRKILFYKLLSTLLNNKDNIKQFNTLLNIMNKDKKTFNKQDILLFDKKEEIDFMQSLLVFTTGLEYIPESIYNDLTDMFFWFQDFKLLSKDRDYNKIDITDKELLDLGYEIIASMNNIDALKLYKEVINKNNHYLKIDNECEINKTVTDKIGGITFENPYNKKGFILLFRNNTIEDIETLVHEFMHFFYNKLLHKVKHNNIKLLRELEGSYGSIYASRYLEKYYKEEANKLREDMIDSVIASSYLIMTNHALFATSSNNQFDLSKAEDRINENLDTFEVSILEEELSSYLTIQGFERITYILAYLFALEIINEDTPNDALNLIYNLKFDDSPNLINLMDEYNIHFQKDGYKDLIKEYKLIHNLKNI